MNAQPTIIVKKTPRYYTPLFSNLYLMGDFNDWTAGDDKYKMSKTGDSWTFIFKNNQDFPLKFLVNRGTAESIETNADKTERAIRSFIDGTQKQSIVISGWKDFLAPSGTAQGNVFILDAEFPLNSLNVTRRIWIYLPSDYFNSTETYPVFYMFDGQNLFDAPYSFVGEWGIDEWLQSELLWEYPAIIVGIENGGMNRINEYTPWKHPEYGGGDGEKTMDAIIHDVKPFIDEYFRTKPDRGQTGIMGSSLGGLMSLFAITAYPDIFSKAGIISPALWFSDSLWSYLDEHPWQQEVKMYIIGGARESESIIREMTSLKQRLIENNYPEEQITVVSHHDGEHNERYWNSLFPVCWKWLWTEPVKKSLNDLSWSSDNDITTIHFSLINNEYISIYVGAADRRVKKFLVREGFESRGKHEITFFNKNLPVTLRHKQDRVITLQISNETIQSTPDSSNNQ